MTVLASVMERRLATEGGGSRVGVGFPIQQLGQNMQSPLLRCSMEGRQPETVGGERVFPRVQELDESVFVTFFCSADQLRHCAVQMERLKTWIRLVDDVG
eukprot:CAMPEP_0194480450 /NCGR_PEP_ID=MMETSP0253-20130528/3245_1 /TAXON_ID=2966 /ORGANISM="Noctiluca scintillans" /LENGTH=99 /DNA_ID=CAMNT_0039319835 /DNA_START=266 /DNA_END=565 /DNA_ORIENTATION=-